MPVKMKRKDLEEVNDEFSDFSLSSPARKIRRLDAELPPIIEEDESDFQLVFEQSIPDEKLASNVGEVRGPVIEELPTVPENVESALVLYKPMNTPLMQSPSGFFVSVNSDLITGFKNQVLWSRQSNPLQASKDEEERWQKNFGATNECLAVVPWVPSHQLPQTPGTQVTQTDVPNSMEAEDMESAAMDIEDDHVGVEERPLGNEEEFGGMSTVGESLHQWQQYCMIPQHSQNTPIVWFR